ncbi:TlpA family protein disulfide reductase [Algivirga pacifica]|uniref:Thioredoxin domain-containing protein n=1 Tax=Algivirga pacifica TaxID=1162670 RepID=A0ABP9D1E2_9BACT
MRFLYYGIIFISLIQACQPKNVQSEWPQPLEVLKTSAGPIAVYDYEHIEPLFQRNNDTTYVINFWATWCKPCVEELPAFQQLDKEYKGRKVKVLLVSLDMKDDKVAERLGKFIQKKDLKSTVVFLDDPDANSWITKVDPNWSGAIPATLIYNVEKRRFFEKSFDYETLSKELEEVMGLEQ